MSTPELDAKLDRLAYSLADAIYGLPRTAGWHAARNKIEAALREAVEAAVKKEREAVRKQIDADCCRIVAITG